MPYVGSNPTPCKSSKPSGLKKTSLAVTAPHTAPPLRANSSLPSDDLPILSRLRIFRSVLKYYCKNQQNANNGYSSSHQRSCPDRQGSLMPIRSVGEIGKK